MRTPGTMIHNATGGISFNEQAIVDNKSVMAAVLLAVSLTEDKFMFLKPFRLFIPAI